MAPKIVSLDMSDVSEVGGYGDLPDNFDLKKDLDRVLELRRVGSVNLTEYRRWLKENIVNEWHVVKLRFYRKNLTRIWSRGYIVIFDDPMDAVAFKLRWA